jgi:hypothetical protein
VAAIDAERVVQPVEPLGVLIAAVGEPAAGLQQDRRPEVFVLVPPIARARSRTAEAQDAEWEERSMRITSWSYAGGGVLCPVIESNKSVSSQSSRASNPSNCAVLRRLPALSANVPKIRSISLRIAVPVAE